MPSPRTVCLAGLAAFLVIVGVEHLLRPDLPPPDHFVSEYSRGSTKPLQVVAFAAWTASMAAAAALAARALPRGRPVSRTVAVLALGVATAGGALAAAFTSQTIAGQLPAGVQRTLGGRLHDLGTLFILAGLVVAALASLRLVRRTRYRLTVVGLGVALVAVVPVLVALRIDAPGIGQRAFILIGCAWLWRFAAEAG